MAKQSRAQKKTVERVMHEYKHGELKSTGGKVRSRRQAVAIALSESGSSRNQSRSENKRRLRQTKRKERRGETARDATEGRRRRSSRTGDTRTRAQLYAEARRREVPGRSHMNKAQLQRALKRR
jgi:predicted nucleic acid-binding Zn ribbon protein